MIKVWARIKCRLKMSKPAKNPLKRYPSQEAPAFPDGSLVVQLYGDFGTPASDLYIITSTPGQDYTAEDLCHMTGSRLGLGPLAMQLFGLVKQDLSVWLAPNDKITCPESGHLIYMFRMRIRPHLCHIEQRSFGGESFDYFFLQVRQDIISDRVGHLENERTLGLGVIDIHRYGREHNLSEQSVLDLSHKHFLPQSVKKSFSKIKTLLLKNGLKTELKKEYAKSGDTSTRKIKLQYINGLLEYVPSYMAENFTLDNGDVLVVDHYHKLYPGVSCVSHGKQYSVCQIEEIMDISLFSRDKRILINRLQGQPNLFTFPRLEQARSFIALVDSYRRLTVDYYFHVCTEVQSPSLLTLNKLRIHGPVNKDWACINLQEQHRKTPDINYLVRQRIHGSESYIVLFIRPANSKVIPLAIQKLDSGKYQIHLTHEPVFDSLPELLRHYEVGKHQMISLQKRLGPSTLKAGDDSGLYLCKPIPQIQEEEEEEELVEELKPEHRRQQKHASVNLVSNISLMPEPLGRGQFTDVYKGFWNKDQSIIQVAVKQLNTRQTSSGKAYQALMEAAQILSFWNHVTIVPFVGLCLHPFQVLEEHAELGSLENYLQKPEQTVYVHHLVTVAEQIAQALRYLQEESTIGSQVHGNIRCRSIVVFDHTKVNIKVKLGDRGMVALYNCQELTHPWNLERLPWLAPELHADLRQMTPHSDRFAFGMTLWELFSLGDRPFLHMEYTKIRWLLNNGVPLDAPKNCPKEIYSLMQQCWRENAVDRIGARELVRDIRNINSAMDPMLCHSEAESHYTNDNLGDLPEQAMVVMRTATQQGLGAGDPNICLLGHGSHGAGSVPAVAAMLDPTGGGLGSRQQKETRDEPMSRLGGPRTTRPSLNGLTEEPTLVDQPSYEHILKRENLKIENGKQLGQGFFGRVYRGRYLDRVVAVKSLRKTNLTSTSAPEFENEFKLMVKFQHPNIVQVIGQCPGQAPGKPMSLVMEYVENGCLLNYIRQHKNDISRTEALRFAEEVAQGMNYLSSKNVVHRDLAARNVLVTLDITMKISDFGLSRLLETNRNYYKCDRNKEMPVRWCAPESQLYFRFSTKSDVWSYGITVWEIFSYGEAPKLCEDRNLHNVLYNGNRLPSPAGCPRIVYTELMLKCWEYYEPQRPDFQHIVNSIHELQTRRVCEETDVNSSPQTVLPLQSLPPLLTAAN